MPSQAMLNALFGFNQVMNERLWAIIMEHLTDEQFAQPDDYSHGSIRNQLVHIANAQYNWLRGLLNVPDLPELDADDYSTREAARIVCQQADQVILNHVRDLSAADLERIPGGWDQPVWAGLLQTSHHGTDHRAQILRTLYDFGAPTFEQNFADYMEYRTPMTVQKVIERIGAKRAEWDDLLRQVPVGQMDQPVLDAWTVRDAIAIINWKERKLLDMIRNRAFVEVSFSELPEAEQGSILDASRALPLPALLEEHQATHRTILDAVRALTEDDLNAENIDGFPPDARFWKAIGVATWWSYPAFTKSLRSLLEGDGSSSPA